MTKKKIFLLLFSLIFFFSQYNFINSVSASNFTSEYIASEDSFVRLNSPNSNYGSWNDITIGKAWNLGNYFDTSQAFIKFNISNINSNAIVSSAYLDVYQYVRSDYASGLYDIQVSKVSSNWSELGITWNNKPGFSGNYGYISVDGNPSQWFNPPKKYTINVTNLVKEWVSDPSHNFGLSIQMASGNYGGFWCSRNYNNSTCFDYSRPKLTVNYAYNNPPNVPNLKSPENLAEFGGDSSNLGSKVTLAVDKLGDPENNLDGTYFYFKQVHDSSWQVSPKRTGQTTAQFTQNFSDGEWQWRARSVDLLGLWSNYSAIKTFFVDTIAPAKPQILLEPEFSPGLSNTIYSEEISDSDVIYYKFKQSEGIDCTENVIETEWQTSYIYESIGLVHNQKYCYQVKAKDKIGNETGWSDAVSSTQDNIFPIIENISIDNAIFSPNNDGILDSIILDLEAFDEYFSNTNISIINAKTGTIERDEIFNENLINFEWEGKDNEGIVCEDGRYLIKVDIFDKAGNLTTDESIIVIIDNNPAILNVSYPVSGSYFNTYNIMVKGITELNSQLFVDEELLSYDQDGFFEKNVDLFEGENNFVIRAIDQAGNENQINLLINRENDLPSMISLNEKNIYNENEQFNFQIKDTNESVKQSGINLNELEIKLINILGEELILVTKGQNVNPDFGEFGHDCSLDPLNGSLECKLFYQMRELPTNDGDYSFDFVFVDFAGNIGQYSYGFIVDTKAYLEIEKPIENEVFTRSEIEFRATFERYGNLQITSEVDERNLMVDEGNEFVEVCFMEEYNSQEIEICEVYIPNFKINSDFDNDIQVYDLIKLDFQDLAGNIDYKEIPVSSNLYGFHYSIDSDTDYISPNGDLLQDNINFSLFVKDRFTDLDAEVSEWGILIKNEANTEILKFQSQGIVLSNYIFDGKDLEGNIIPDGKYSYQLYFTSFDGILFETDLKYFYSKTHTDDEVFITSPKNNTVTTKGVVNVVGIAPANSRVKLFVVNEINFDESQYYEIIIPNTEGFFSTIVPIYSKQTIIYAYATDEYGLSTEKSNEVKIILDFEDPLLSAEIIPIVSATGKQVMFKSEVTQNTEYVDVKFRLYSNISSNQEDFSDIGFMDGIENEFKGDICTNSICNWDMFWTTPLVEGGIYEIEFTAKKAEKFKTISVGFKIDGTIPIGPNILRIIDPNDFSILRKSNENYMTNSNTLILQGITEESSFVNLYLNGELIEEKIDSDLFGNWNSIIKFENLTHGQVFKIEAEAIDNVGNVSGVKDIKMIEVDLEAPNLTQIETSNNYKKSGDIADINYISSEYLYSSYLINKEAQTNFSKGEELRYSAMFTIDSKANEGDYLIKIVSIDFAGNTSFYDFSFIIDNTSPKSTEIITSEWGKLSGIKASLEYPSLGRIVPGYVTRNPNIKLSGFSEKDAFVEIYISSEFKDEIIPILNFCEGKTFIYSNKVTDLCFWEYELNLTSEKGYYLNTQVKDRAGNYSEKSQDLLLYFDITSPKIPEIYNIENVLLDEIGYTTNKIDINLIGSAERLSDLKIEKYFKDKKEENIIQTSNKSVWSNNTKLGQKVGKDEDGLYSFTVQSFDSAGNESEKLKFNIERDTISPEKPDVKFGYKLDIMQTYLILKGESNSQANISIQKNNIYYSKFSMKLDQSGNVSMTNPVSWINGARFDIVVTLEDRAGNVSQTVSSGITLPNWSGDIPVQTTGSKIDPYGGLYGSGKNALNGKVKIFSDGTYEKDFKFNSPQITYTYTNDDGSVDLWGIVPLEGNVRIEFYKKHKEDFWKDLEEAFANCGYEKYIPVANIILAPICVQENYQKIQNRQEFDHAIDNFNFKLQNNEIDVFRYDSKEDIEIYHGVKIDQNGRFSARIPSSLLKPKECVNVVARTWGYYKFDSNEVHYYEYLPKSNYIQVIRPDDPTPNGLPIQYFYMLTGTPKTHAQRPEKAALDLVLYNYAEGSGYFKDDKAVIKANMDGYAVFHYASNGSAIVTITSTRNYQAHYAHIEDHSVEAKKIIGTFPKYVRKGEIVAYQGDTGFFGIQKMPEHLHYEISIIDNLGKVNNFDSILNVCNMAGIEEKCYYRNNTGYPPITYYSFNYEKD